jgi:hypothetical protein
MALMNGFIKLRLATFFSDMARVILRGYRSMPATEGKNETSKTSTRRHSMSQGHAFKERSKFPVIENAVNFLLAVALNVQALPGKFLPQA